MLKKIALVICLVANFAVADEVIVSELRLECYEDGKLTQKWIGMFRLEPNNNWMKYTIISDKPDKIGIEHWVAAEKDTEMKIANVKVSKDGEEFTFDLVYPLNRGSIRFEGKKRSHTPTILYDLRGAGIVKWAILEGKTNNSLITNQNMKVAGKPVFWRF